MRRRDTAGRRCRGIPKMSRYSSRMRRSWAGPRGSRTKETERGGGTIPSDYDKRLGKNKRVALGESRQPRRREQARQGGDGVPTRPSVLVATGRKQGELATIEGRETRSLRTTGDDTETTQTRHRRGCREAQLRLRRTVARGVTAGSEPAT